MTEGSWGELVPRPSCVVLCATIFFNLFCLLAFFTSHLQLNCPLELAKAMFNRYETLLIPMTTVPSQISISYELCLEFLVILDMKSTLLGHVTPCGKINLIKTLQHQEREHLCIKHT